LDAPLDDEWVVGKTCAKAFDVLVQCVPKGDEYRSDLFVVLCCEKLRTESADSIFHTTHGAGTASQTVQWRDGTIPDISLKCYTFHTPEMPTNPVPSCGRDDAIVMRDAELTVEV